MQANGVLSLRTPAAAAAATISSHLQPYERKTMDPLTSISFLERVGGELEPFLLAAKASAFHTSGTFASLHQKGSVDKSGAEREEPVFTSTGRRRADGGGTRVEVREMIPVRGHETR